MSPFDGKVITIYQAIDAEHTLEHNYAIFALLEGYIKAKTPHKMFKTFQFQSNERETFTCIHKVCMKQRMSHKYFNLIIYIIKFQNDIATLK